MMEKMTKAQLLEVAEQKGIKVSKKANKETIIAALRAGSKKEVPTEQTSGEY